MNKKFLVAWLTLFVVWFAGSYTVNDIFMGADWAQFPVFRPWEEELNHYYHFMILAHVLQAGTFVWLYVHLVEKKPWFMRGMQFGVAIALLTHIPTFLMVYAMMPIPGYMAVEQIFYFGILLIVLGLIVAWIYRDEANGASRSR